jgi:hypothetical protein
MVLGGDPRLLVRNRHDLRAKRAHPVELGLRRGLDRNHRRGNPERPRGISDSLPRIARADRPHAFRAFLVAQARDGIGRSADLVGVGRLQIFELEPDFRSVSS